MKNHSGIWMFDNSPPSAMARWLPHWIPPFKFPWFNQKLFLPLLHRAVDHGNTVLFHLWKKKLHKILYL